MLPAALVSADPILAVQVQAILANPVAAQHPDLVHFRPMAGGTIGSGPGAPWPPSAAGPPDVRLAIIVTFAAIALAACVVLGALHGQQGRWSLRRSMVKIAGPLAGAVVVASGAGGAALLGAVSTPPPAAPAATPAAGAVPASMLSSLRSHSALVSVGAASPTWTSLVSIESTLETQRDRLASDEQQIAEATAQLTSSSATPRVDSRRPSVPGVLKAALEQLVSDHDAVLGSYNTTLQKEYSFYVATAQSPQSAGDLTAVAAHAPPDIQEAITTNLSLVQTQLQQEAQIDAAASTATAQMYRAGTVVADLSGPAPSFDAPVQGVLTQPFGATKYPLEPPITYNGVFYPHFHTGLDLAAALDTPVHAAAAGRVVLAASSVDAQGHLTGYGNFVMVAHADGYFTLYAHLDKILVKVGQSLQQGEVLGLLGSTGWSTGPHVHFEIRKGEVYVDPAPYLGSQIHS